MAFQWAAGIVKPMRLSHSFLIETVCWDHCNFQILEPDVFWSCWSVWTTRMGTLHICRFPHQGYSLFIPLIRSETMEIHKKLNPWPTILNTEYPWQALNKCNTELFIFLIHRPTPTYPLHLPAHLQSFCAPTKPHLLLRLTFSYRKDWGCWGVPYDKRGVWGIPLLEKSLWACFKFPNFKLWNFRVSKITSNR